MSAGLGGRTRRATAILAVFLAALLALGAPASAQSPCGGVAAPLTHLPGGSAPYARFAVDGVEGSFLLDYGSTESSVSRERFPDADDPMVARRFTLPGFASGRFRLVDYSGFQAPEGGLIGVIGTDFLSLLTASVDFEEETAWFSVAPCDAEALLEAGYRPVRQTGFFSSNLARLHGRPNVPVLFLEIEGLRFPAQVDSGYDDLAYPLSLDVNAPLFDALRRAGGRLEPAGGIQVVTCDGAETRDVWRLMAPLRVLGDDGATIRSLAGAHVIPKRPNQCGGVADSAEPAGQIGGSTLRRLGRLVFDPRSERLWIGPQE